MNGAPLAAIPSGPVLKPNTCSVCKYMSTNGGATSPVCRRFPPTTAFMSHPKAGMVPISAYPPTKADEWCGEFMTRLQVA